MVNGFHFKQLNEWYPRKILNQKLPVNFPTRMLTLFSQAYFCRSKEEEKNNGTLKLISIFQ